MKKYKVNLNRSKITSEEIASRRDFDTVLKSYSKVSKPFYKTAGFAAGSAIAAIAIAVGVWWYSASGTNDNNSVRETADLTAKQDFTYQPRGDNREYRKSWYVNPPLGEKMNVQFASYKVNAGKGGEFIHQTGSKLKVPKDAFVDENGDIVKGEVEVRYREFKDPVEVFVSGIPMTYDSAGTQYHFESAGMMEMYAFRNGKPVKVNPGKKIEVEMVSKFEGDYNFYELDTVARNWVYRGKDKVKKEIPKQTSQPDDLALVKNFIDNNDMGTDPVTMEKEKVSSEIKEIKKDIARIEKTKPQEPKKADSNRPKFNIDVDANDFPELAVYRNTVFEVGEESAKDFKREMYNVEWDDAQLAEGSNKGVNYRLTLTKGKEKHTLTVYPVLAGKNYEQAAAEYKEKFRKYEAALTKRKEDEQKKTEEYNALVKKLEEERMERQRIWEAQQEAMKQQAAEMALQASKTNQVYRVMQISNFGTFNCDNPKMLPKGNTVMASFSDKEGNKLSLYNVLLVEKKRNTYFTYYPQAFDKFSYNPKEENLILSVTPGGKGFAIFTVDEFKSVPSKKGLYEFRMTVVDREFENIKELKAFLNI
jgi:hypothetical protein